MTITRQSDQIWHTSAMTEGRQDRGHSETHDKAVRSSHDYGRHMGERHANEAWKWEHRDDHGRFAPTPEHHAERHEQEGREPRGKQRDAFIEGYHVGFSNHIKQKEREGHEKKSSALYREAVKVDPYTGDLLFENGSQWDDPEEKEDLFRHKLQHGTEEGWTSPRHRPKDHGDDDYELGDNNPNPSERNPAAVELADLADYADYAHNVPLTKKYPFSAKTLAEMEGKGNDGVRRSRAIGNLPAGQLASRPMTTVDRNGKTHTFYHHVTTEFPRLNPKAGQPGEPKIIYSPEYPAKKAEGVPNRLVLALHHHNGDQWLKPMTTNHTLTPGENSTSRRSDLNAAFRTNDQTRTLYDQGIQRVGDWDDEIGFEYRLPNGKVRIRRINGDDSRYRNGRSGTYYDPELEKGHPDYIGEHWEVTPLTRRFDRQWDSNSDDRMVAHTPVRFPADDDHGFNNMVDFVKSGAGVQDLAQPGSEMPQRQMESDEGKPPARFNPREGRVWSPEHNIHRSAERPGLPW